jgi:hypothetical protein
MVFLKKTIEPFTLFINVSRLTLFGTSKSLIDNHAKNSEIINKIKKVIIIFMSVPDKY